uniref:Uncharacterized protein n=1 Tax=Acrobeloides nanus TaxID=290746 RepID=A0A914C940_9BILA
MLSPYLGIPEIQVDMMQYDNRVVAIHNYLIAGIYPVMYLLLCIMLLFKTKGGHAQESVSSLQKQIILQSIIVSALLAITAVSYMVMQYYPVPEFMFIATHFIWQASHGASVFTYIFVNKSMRKEAILMIKATVMRARGRNPGHVINPLNPVSMHINPTWLQGRSTRTYVSNPLLNS